MPAGLLGIEELDRAEIAAILARAKDFQPMQSQSLKKLDTLRGKMIVNLFFEASTRTRTSFEIAAKRLGADAVSITASGSSVSKGESLVDTLNTLGAMRPDAIVMRHAASGAPHFLAATMPPHPDAEAPSTLGAPLGPRNMRLGEILLERGKIEAEDIERALELQLERGDKLGKILVDMGTVAHRDVLAALSDQLDVPLVAVDGTPPSAPEIEGLSHRFLRQCRAIPVALVDNVLTIAMADPLDFETIAAVRAFSGLQVRAALAAEQEILDAIDRNYGESEQRTYTEGDDEAGADLEHLRDMASEAPVIRLGHAMIADAIEKRASDIHIEPFEKEFRVRFRVDGVLFSQEPPPRELKAAIISRLKLMAKLNIAERRLPQDGRIKIKILGREVDLRVSTLPTLYGESVVMRLLDRSAGDFYDLRRLGFDDRMLARMEYFTSLPHGMFLVTGPTGSGKSTTLYSALKRINLPDKKIITIEDPVEYQMDGINQIHVNPQIGLTFAAGLRHIVRQDPDVIMVGEIRDRETADVAIRAALTGHLVFSTLHTNDGDD